MTLKRVIDAVLTACPDLSQYVDIEHRRGEEYYAFEKQYSFGCSTIQTVLRKVLEKLGIDRTDVVKASTAIDKELMIKAAYCLMEDREEYADKSVRLRMQIVSQALVAAAVRGRPRVPAH
jgi:hypothetical protein